MSVRGMHRAFAVLLLFRMMCGNIGCTHRQQLRKEASLREALLLLPSEIGQFTLDHQRELTSLSELVSGGYIRQIPADPLTRCYFVRLKVENIGRTRAEKVQVSRR